MAGRQALLLVSELNRQLGQWQAASVKLKTIAERLSVQRMADAAVVAEARALLELVGAEQERFERTLPGQPAVVVQHSHIKDTQRSFAMVTERLRTTLTLLGVPPERE